MSVRDHAFRFESICRPSAAKGFPGFTLIELLTVLAIVGILAGILFPATLAVRRSAERTHTRLRFQQWTSAIEGFRREYGVYPVFAADGKVNGQAATDPSAPHLFHDVLSGRRRDGTGLPGAVDGEGGTSAEYQNPRRIDFLNLNAGEIFPDNEPNPERRNLIRDSFGNTDIAVLVDADGDGFIDIDDRASLPVVSPPDDATRHLVPSQMDFPEEGLRAGVVFYSAPPGAREPEQLVLSWK